MPRRLSAKGLGTPTCSWRKTEQLGSKSTEVPGMHTGPSSHTAETSERTFMNFPVSKTKCAKSVGKKWDKKVITCGREEITATGCLLTQSVCVPQSHVRGLGTFHTHRDHVGSSYLLCSFTVNFKTTGCLLLSLSDKHDLQFLNLQRAHLATDLTTHSNQTSPSSGGAFRTDMTEAPAGSLVLQSSSSVPSSLHKVSFPFPPIWKCIC